MLAAPIEQRRNQDPDGDRDLPPYDDRQKTGVGTDADKLAQERGGLPGHDAGPREVSDAEREGMTDTDMAPSGPLSGTSTSTRGEDLAPTSEKAQRADRLDTGVSDEAVADQPRTAVIRAAN